MSRDVRHRLERKSSILSWGKVKSRRWYRETRVVDAWNLSSNCLWAGMEIETSCESLALSRREENNAPWRENRSAFEKDLLRLMAHVTIKCCSSSLFASVLYTLRLCNYTLQPLFTLIAINSRVSFTFFHRSETRVTLFRVLSESLITTRRLNHTYVANYVRQKEEKKITEICEKIATWMLR